jgi:hypothetical protein
MQSLGFLEPRIREYVKRDELLRHRARTGFCDDYGMVIVYNSHARDCHVITQQ